MRIALLQARGTPGDVEANVAAVERAAAEARQSGARLLITPEAFLTGYDVPDLKALALPEPPHIGAEGIAVLVGWAERRGRRVFNTATLSTPTAPPGSPTASCTSTARSTATSSRRATSSSRPRSTGSPWAS